VVGAIIVDDLDAPTRVLAARRSEPSQLAGYWEFPGGKVETGESAEAALVREVEEELGATLEVGTELRHPDGSWPVSDDYHLRLFFARAADGVPAPGDSHDAVRWLRADDMDDFAWLPSDRAAIEPVRQRLG
jgi:8-oxo-dGTP diphosphatase